MPKKNKGGRPSKKDTISLTQLETLAGLGLTMEEMSQVLGINVDTLYTYQKDPKFSEVIKRGKVKADQKVVKSLYKRACGYKYDEVTQEIREGELKVTKVVTKEIHPDTTAQIFWLKNRRSNDWRDKQEMKVSGSLTLADMVKKSNESDKE